MRGVHQRLINSEFKGRYLALKRHIPRIKHLIHGGVENYYAELENEHIHSCGVVDRLCDEIIERTLSNLEIGLERVTNLDMVDGEMYVHCHPRYPRGEKTREAIWQYDIFADYKPVAVIGMNFHIEDAQIVATVPNIQGHDSKGIRLLRDICGKTPWPVKSLTLIVSYLPRDIRIVRGAASRNHPFAYSDGFDKHRASNLYDRTFRRLGMEVIRGSQGKLRYYELKR